MVALPSLAPTAVPLLFEAHVTVGLLLLNLAAARFSCLPLPLWAGGGLTLDFGFFAPFPHTLFFQTLLGDRRAVPVSGPPHPCPCPGARLVPRHPVVTPLPSSPALTRGDRHHRCCNTVEVEERGNGTPSPDLPRHCPELGRSGSPACTCLRDRWLR